MAAEIDHVNYWAGYPGQPARIHDGWGTKEGVDGDFTPSQPAWSPIWADTNGDGFNDAQALRVEAQLGTGNLASAHAPDPSTAEVEAGPSNIETTKLDPVGSDELGVAGP